jgi:3,5-epimerase/4-reductase
MVGPKVHDGIDQHTFEPVHHGPQSFLIWGGNGWVAGHLYRLLKSQGKAVSKTTVRMEDREGVMEVLESVRPTHVLNCAGCTGRPNVDWCEDNKEATIRSNVIGTLNLTDCCFLLGIHVTVFATGCKPHSWETPSPQQIRMLTRFP